MESQSGTRMELGERLARIESKIEHITSMMENFVDGQDIKNTMFFQVRDEFLKSQASQRGAWFTVGLFGTLTVAVSSAVAWFVSTFHMR